MKTIKDALKELVVVFGGAENVKAVKGNKITEILKKLKEAIVSSGAAEKELPEATSEDVGKAVMVDKNGGYALGNAGGGDKFSITLTVTYQGPGTGNVYKINKTFSDIVDALLSGTEIDFTVISDGSTKTFAKPTFVINYIGEGTSNVRDLSFSFIETRANASATPHVYCVWITQDNLVTVKQTEIGSS